MKILRLLGFLVCAGTVTAQYFSAGWSPNQSVQEETQTASSVSSPVASQTSPSSATGYTFNLTRILSSEPVASFLSRLGVNITASLEAAGAAKSFWDDRIPLITDDNYGDIIVNETMTLEEEEQRMWFLVITTTSASQEGLSKYLDDVFDSAYNTTQVEGDLQAVRWGRIDYLNVTALTTKWVIWKAPYLVFVTNRGKTLRFLPGTRLRLDPERMRGYLTTESWKTLEPWSTAYSPGGSREWVMDILAIIFTKIYNVTRKIPRWAFILLSGGIGSLLLSVMHGTPAKAEDKKSPPVVESPSSPAPAPAQSPKRTGTRQRKTVKK